MLNYNQALPKEKSYQDLQMKELKPIMKLIIRGKKREFLSAIGKSLNLLLPTEANTSSRSENLTALWLSPDEWMIYSNETLNSENNDYEIENLSPCQAKELVLKRWVIKEAAVKWQRGKIANNINQWIWKNKSSFAHHKKLGHKVKVYEQNYDQWTYAIALDEDSITYKPIICVN